MKFVALSLLCGSAAAFAPASPSGAFVALCPNFLCSRRPPMTAQSSMALSAEKSPAMPFLPYPENLKGYIGDDIGFDPLRISDYFPMDYLREAELKHGRIAMLATVGYIATDVGFVVHPLATPGITSATAHDTMAAAGVMGNLAWPLAFLEIVSYIGVAEMLQGSGREPGDLGFGSSYLVGKSDEYVKDMKYKEIMNGRLAMFAIGGMLTQSVLFDKGFPYF